MSVDNDFRKLEKHFKPLMGKIKRLENHFDYKNYYKSEEEFKKTFEDLFAKIIKKPIVHKLLRSIIENANISKIFNELLEFNQKQLVEMQKADPRLIKLESLIEKADKIAPYISIIILSRINIREHLKKAFEPYDLLEESEILNGQHQARLVLRLFREIYENQYDNYIRIIWELTSILKNKIFINSSILPGQIMTNLLPRLNYLNMLELIEQDAVFIRNSATHASYDYKLETHSVILWDRQKGPREYSVLELLKKAKKMYWMVSNYLFWIDIYYLNKSFNISELMIRLKGEILNHKKIKEFEINKWLPKEFLSTVNKYKFKR